MQKLDELLEEIFSGANAQGSKAVRYTLPAFWQFQRQNHFLFWEQSFSPIRTLHKMPQKLTENKQNPAWKVYSVIG